MMKKRSIGTVLYTATKIPDGYKCDGCGASGVKLWREYGNFADETRLLCASCAAKDQNEDISTINEEGMITTDYGGETDQIGWYVPAIPVEGENTYWGYSSVPVPDEGIEWWKSLPNA
jgi:hypothetical protein